MALKLRRGTDAERQLITPEAGEPLWIDNEALWIGDGSTVGGIKVTGGIENDLATVSIDALSDVDITSSAPTNGQTLVWNTDKFEPGLLALTINDLTNVDVVSNPPSNGDSLIWNGSEWAPGTPTFASGGNITGNLIGDIYSQDGLTKILENGPDGTGSTYSGRVNGELIGNVTGDVDGDLTGNHIGDIYAQNGTSKILENGTDGTDSTYSGRVNGELIGNVTGDLAGSVFADDSSIIVDAINGTLHGDINSINGDIRILNTQTINVAADTEEPILKLTSETNTGTFGNPIISINNNHTGTYGQEITFNRSNGTHAAPTAAQSGDYSGSITVRAHDGSDFTTIGAMHVVADDVRGTDDVDSCIYFLTRNGSIAGDYGTMLKLGKGAEVSGYVQFGSYTTAERDALTAANGMVIYNTTDNKFQGYENGAWANLI